MSEISSLVKKAYKEGFRDAQSPIADMGCNGLWNNSKSKRDVVVKSEWVSVDDDLPPLGDNYHGAHYSGIHWNCGAFTGSWDDDFRRSSMKAKGYTHWQSLTAPPKQ